MSTELKPWMITELAHDNKKTSLVDDLVALLNICWEKNEDDFQAMAQSTDDDDSVQGSVKIDKTLLSWLVLKAALPAGFHRVAHSDVKEIKGVIHHAAKRVGLDRKMIAARKAEYAALQAAEPAGDQPEPNPNGQHDQGAE